MGAESLGSVGVDVEPQTLAQLEALAGALAKLTEKQKATADAASAGALTWASAKTQINAFGSHITDLAAHLGNTREVVEGFLDTVDRVADRIADLTTEQESLDRSSRRLGLDFDEGAAAAGRFVDETETMGTAARFAEAGVRLTQQELNALARVAGAFAQNEGITTAQVFQQLTDGTLSGTEALRRFGPEMARLQGPSHTVAERLRALVHHAEQVPQAADSAADAVARFRDQLEDSERVMATAFVEELRTLDRVSSGLNQASTDAEDFNRTLHAVGATGADMAALLGNAFAIVLTIIPAGLHAIGGAVADTARALAALAQGDFEGARNAYSMSDSTRALGEFVNARGAGINAAWGRLMGGGSPGAGGPLAGIQRGDMNFSVAEAHAIDASGMSFTEDEARALEADATARNRRGQSGTRPMTNAQRRRAAEAEADRYQREQEAEQQLRRAAAEAEVDRLGQQMEDEAKARRAAAEASNPLNVDDSDAQKARRAEAEASMLANRLDLHRGFTEEFEALHQRQVRASVEAADSISDALQAFGGAYGDAILAVVTGEASLGEALQGMLSKTLSTIGKEASVKAGFQLAEGLATLFLNPAEAAGHFAAAAAFTGVAATAGALGAATAPDKTPKSAGASGGSARAAAEQLGGRSASESERGGGTTIHQYYAPVIDGRASTRDLVGLEVGSYTDAAARERRMGRRREP